MNNLLKTLTLAVITCFTSVSLISRPTSLLLADSSIPSESKLSEFVDQSNEESLSEKPLASDDSPETNALKKVPEDALKEIDEAQELEVIMENSDELNPSFEDQDIEDKSHTASDADSDVLYDPNMNYGKGAPVPSPSPLTTKQRNLVAFLASVVLATVGMFASAHNSGKSPAPGAPKCP